MARCTVNLWIKAFVVLITWIYSRSASGAVYDLYNTKLATSDLRWTKEPRNSWEEVSGFDRHNNAIRSYQVCKLGQKETNNWLRSPFIKTREARLVYIDVAFSIAKCGWKEMNMDYCRQTFNLFYYWSERDVASSTFPPWQERSYFKIDTVAANSNDEINEKTFKIGPLEKTGGIYIAAQDQGACMSLISLRVYYYYCAKTINSLATFAETMTGRRAASLVSVTGKCIPNAEKVSEIEPKYYCGSTGEWQIMTGSCKCKAGFHPNAASTACLPCPIGYFKSDSGNSKCMKCPANSGPITENSSTPATASGGSVSLINLPEEGLLACPCHTGYARAKGESASKACTRIPSAPIFGITRVNSTSVYIAWKKPVDLGNRGDLYYRITCDFCDVNKKNCVRCPASVSFSTYPDGYPKIKAPLRTTTMIRQNEIEITDLAPYTHYVFKVFARNGVSEFLEESNNYFVKQITTEESVPPAVVNMRVGDTSPHSAMVSWQPPLNPGGKIVGYEVKIVLSYSPDNYPSGASSDFRVHESVMTQETSCTLTDLKPNTEYQVRIRAQTSVGFGKFSSAVTFKTSSNVEEGVPAEPGNNSVFLMAALATVLALAVVCCVVVFYYGRRRSRTRTHKAGKNMTSLNQTLVDRAKPAVVLRKQDENHHTSHRDSNRTTYVDYPDPRRAVLSMNKEVSPVNLKLHNTIGEGEFAVVYKATMMEGNQMRTVAAKQLKDSAGVKDQSNFLREACTMAQFDHPNILQLKGVIIKHQPEMIISEFMENGSLFHFLKRHEGKLSIHQLVKMLQGIANGMQYLSEMQFVHRDLAARNILVDSNFICKVSDFGLSRTLENDPHATYTTQGGKIALRWTAPECIRFREFTSASDVWSFGIVMWEVMSYGEKPYWNMTNNEVMKSIANGMRLPAPTGCPKALHELMLECWYLDPIRRPSFEKIVSDLSRFLRHSSLLQIRREDEMEQEVCCSPDDRSEIFIDQSGESYLEQAQPLTENHVEEQDLDYPGSDSSSISQDDTCSSVVVTDERCLNV